MNIMPLFAVCAAVLVLSTGVHSQPAPGHPSFEEELATLSPEGQAVNQYVDQHYTLAFVRPSGELLTKSDPEYPETGGFVQTCSIVVVWSLRDRRIASAIEAADTFASCLQEFSDSHHLGFTVQMTYVRDP